MKTGYQAHSSEIEVNLELSYYLMPCPKLSTNNQVFRFEFISIKLLFCVVGNACELPLKSGNSNQIKHMIKRESKLFLMSQIYEECF